MPRKTELASLRKIAVRIGESSNSLPAVPITGFMAMVGSQFRGDLMVVGRSVNGWTRGLQPQEFSDRNSLETFLDNVYESATSGKPCPMQWVSQRWGNYNHDYNTRKSAFWRVIRRVVGELQIADVERPEWPSYLLWSNLYKFAPEKGGNPSSTLCNIQLDGCKSLLRKEIEKYRPKRILFLTGIGWAEPFIAKIQITTIPAQQYVEGVGRLDGPQQLQSCVVVVTHPQGKKEDIWVREVMNAFDNC